MHTLLSILSILCVINLFGQSSWYSNNVKNLIPYNIEGNTLIVESSNHLRSRFLSSDYLLSLYDYKTFTEGHKTNINRNIEEINKILLDSRSSIQKRIQINKEAPLIDELLLSLEFRALGNAKIDENLLQLCLNGNYMFKGQIADFPNSYITLQTFTSFGIETRKKMDIKNETIHILPKVSILKGLRLLDLKLVNSSLYTSQLGDSILGKIDFQQISNQDQFGGWGLSLDLVSYWYNDKNFVQLEINDLGAIYWNNIQKTTIDTTILFQGFELNNLFEQDSNFQIKSPIVSNSRESKESVYLPTNVNLQYLRTIDERILFEAKMRIYVGHKYYNQYYLGNRINLNFLQLKYGVLFDESTKNYFEFGASCFTSRNKKHRLFLETIFDPTQKTVLGLQFMGILSL